MSETIQQAAPTNAQEALRAASVSVRVMGALAICQLVERGADKTEGLSPTIEHDNFAKTAPSLTGLAPKAALRSISFNYLGGSEHESADNIFGTEAYPYAKVANEGEAILGFTKFIDRLSEEAEGATFDQPAVDDLVSNGTRSLLGTSELDRPVEGVDVKQWIKDKCAALKETSFLGSEEFDEATAGLAKYWYSYLTEDPERQICIPATSEGKSSAFVLESVLSRFDPETVKALEGRFVPRVVDLSAAPDKAKIVLVDDWMMGGDQMFTRAGSIFFGEDFGDTTLEDKYGKCLEINLLMADKHRVEEGASYVDRDKRVPVKAYFKAPDAADSGDLNGPDDRFHSRISGVNSSADIHFSITVSNILTLLTAAGSTEPHAMPALTNIVRKYRTLEAPTTSMLLRKAS